MAKDKEIKELRNLPVEELQTRLNNARQELMNLRFQQSTGELTDYNRLRFTRRQIARIQTLIKERQDMVDVEGGS